LLEEKVQYDYKADDAGAQEALYVDDLGQAFNSYSKGRPFP
jgi:hypothetical protein